MQAGSDAIRFVSELPAAEVDRLFREAEPHLPFSFRDDPGFTLSGGHGVEVVQREPVETDPAGVFQALGRFISGLIHPEDLLYFDVGPRTASLFGILVTRGEQELIPYPQG